MPVRKLVVAVVVLVLVLVGLGFAARGYLAEVADRAQEQAAGRPAATLTDLSRVDQLKDDFNAASGEPRLILIFSPT
jgi:hypothetical protein